MKIEPLIKKMYQMDDPEFLDNPYKTFEQLREYGPLVPSGEGQWLATTHAAVKKTMLSPAFGRGDMYRVPPYTDTLSPVEIMRKNWMLYNDPPNHTKLKKFSTNVLDDFLDQDLKNRTADISKMLIEMIDFSKPFDLVEAYAYPLPLLVIADLLGVPKEDRHHFKEWSAQVNRTLEPCVSLEEKKTSDDIVKGVYSYFNDLIREKKYPPGSILDTLSKEIDGEKLTYDEIIYTAVLLLIAGHETTSSMTALGILTLMKFPEIYAFLKKNPHCIDRALDELLRYEAPVQMARRVALEDTTLLDHNFKAGEMVTGLFGSANYDPAVFENPYDFIYDRKSAHLAFGYGVHYCLGAKLARLEGFVVFRDLISKIPLMSRVNQTLDWKKNIVLRGLHSLWVTV